MLALDVERVTRLIPPTPEEAQVGALSKSVGRAYLSAWRSGAPQMDALLREAVVALVTHKGERILRIHGIAGILSSASCTSDP